MRAAHNQHIALAAARAKSVIKGLTATDQCSRSTPHAGPHAAYEKHAKMLLHVAHCAGTQMVR